MLERLVTLSGTLEQCKRAVSGVILALSDLPDGYAYHNMSTTYSFVASAGSGSDGKGMLSHHRPAPALQALPNFATESVRAPSSSMTQGMGVSLGAPAASFSVPYAQPAPAYTPTAVTSVYPQPTPLYAPAYPGAVVHTTQAQGTQYYDVGWGKSKPGVHG